MTGFDYAPCVQFALCCCLKCNASRLKYGSAVFHGGFLFAMKGNGRIDYQLESCESFAKISLLLGRLTKT
jgi:hypothetical protein